MSTFRIFFIHDIFKICINDIDLDKIFKKIGMRNPNGVSNPKWPYFFRVLAIFSHFLVKISTFRIFFIRYIFELCINYIDINIKLKKSGMRNTNGHYDRKKPHSLTLTLTNIYVSNIFLSWYFTKSCIWYRAW